MHAHFLELYLPIVWEQTSFIVLFWWKIIKKYALTRTSQILTQNKWFNIFYRNAKYWRNLRQFCPKPTNNNQRFQKLLWITGYAISNNIFCANYNYFWNVPLFHVVCWSLCCALIFEMNGKCSASDIKKKEKKLRGGGIE